MSIDQIPSPEKNPWKIVRDEEIELSGENDRSIGLIFPHAGSSKSARVDLSVYTDQKSLYLSDIDNEGIPLSRKDHVFLLKALIEIMHTYGCETFGAIAVNPSAANILSYIADPSAKAVLTNDMGPVVTLGQLENAVERVSRWINKV